MKKVLTIIVDGFGIRGETKDNAIANANMHSFEQFFKDYPHTLIDTSKESMGLLDNELINCENAHKILGGGRLFHSKRFLINEFWDEYKDNETFIKLIGSNEKPTHLFCFLKKDNVKNIVSCYNALKEAGFKKIYIHIISYNESSTLVEKLYNAVNKDSFVSICGIDFISDLEQSNIQKYFNAITSSSSNSQELLSYLKRYKEFNAPFNRIKPTRINKNVTIDMDDNIIWLDPELDNVNILQALSEFGTNIYTYFKVEKIEKNNYFIDYENDDNSLGVYLGKLDFKQARVVQTEKSKNLTDFFDSYTKKIPNCDKYIIDSTIDRPEMNIVDVTKKVIELMDKDYSLILVNFANCDIYGQKEDMNGAIQACMSVDVCLAKLIEEAETNFYTIFLISDHGRIDNVKHPDQASSLVPFVINDDKVKLKEGGTLKDFAPTLLDYMEISIPSEMTGESLLMK